MQKRLAALPRRLVRESYGKGLEQAATVVADEVRSRVPVGDSGLLKESVITRVEVGDDGGTAAVGFDSSVESKGQPQDLVALAVEFGHFENSGSGHVSHVPAHPFMRPAADAAAQRSLAAFAKVIGEALPAAVEGSGDV